MPAASVELAKVGGKVVLQKHPPLARLRRFDPALPRVQPQDSRGHSQEAGGLLQVEGAHRSVLPMTAHPHVVATRLGLGLPADVVLQSLGELPRRVVVVLLERM